MHEEHHNHESQSSEVHKSKQPFQLSVPIAIIIAGALVAGAVYLSNSKTAITAANNQGQRVAQGQPANNAVDISKVKTSGEAFIGNPNAPATMAYWYDYQCPFCKKFETEVMPQLIKDYVQTGKLKIVFKDFQFLGSDSQAAGLAARAVWEVAPDKFQEFHQAMYAKQDGENSGWGNKDDIMALIKTIPGIDANKVAQLIVSKEAEYQKAMDADKAEGSSFGINGTPGSIIGKQLISGAQPYSAVKQVVDLALQGK